MNGALVPDHGLIRKPLPHSTTILNHLQKR